MTFASGRGREVEDPLLGVLPVAEEHRLHERLGQRVPLVGHRHRHAQLFPDLLGLAEDDVEHGAVHRVVGTVDERGPYDLGPLAEAVDTPFPLLVAGRVPGQVVVDDGVEVLLEVDTLGEAVGRDEEPLLGLAEQSSTFSFRSSEVSSPVTTSTVTPLYRSRRCRPR